MVVCGCVGKPSRIGGAIGRGVAGLAHAWDTQGGEKESQQGELGGGKDTFF